MNGATIKIKTQIFTILNAVTAYQATKPFFPLFSRWILTEEVKEVSRYSECQMREKR